MATVKDFEVGDRVQVTGDARYWGIPRGAIWTIIEIRETEEDTILLQIGKTWRFVEPDEIVYVL